MESFIGKFNNCSNKSIKYYQLILNKVIFIINKNVLAIKYNY